MKDTALNIDIPEELLTDADIAGRAIRIARANWLPLLKLFLPQAIAYSIATSLLLSDFSDSGMDVPDAVTYWAIIAGFTLMLFSLWEWGIRSFALIHCITKGNGDLSQSLEFARKYMWQCLIVLIPVYISEACIFGMLVLSTFFEKISGVVQHSEVDPAGMLAGALAIIPLILTIPLAAILVANVFYLAILVIEQSSLLGACGRFFQLSFRHFKYFCVFTSLLSAISVISQVPVGVLGSLSLIIPKSPLKLIVDFIFALVFFPPIDAFISSATAIGAVCLYKQLCNRLEARDILEKLEKLEGRNIAS
jgi:hypothetical protein